MTDVKIDRESMGRLIEKAKIKAIMIQMGEKIAFGSDTAIMHEQSEAICALLDAKEAAEAERDRLRELVKKAFNEGFSSGVADFQTSRGGVTWYESKSRAALQKDTDNG